MTLRMFYYVTLALGRFLWHTAPWLALACGVPAVAFLALWRRAWRRVLGSG